MTVTKTSNPRVLFVTVVVTIVLALDDPSRFYCLATRSLQEPSNNQCVSAIDGTTLLLYPLQSEEESISLNLTREFVLDKLNVTKDLADMVNREEYGPVEELAVEQQKLIDWWEIFDGFGDYNDQALVAKTVTTQICFATFQSTDPGNGVGAFMMDQWQNLNPFTTQVGDCIVRRGIIDAYNATYKDGLRKSLDACVSSCDDGPCPLVLGGFSQGGSAAIAASIDLKHYNPEVITFAAFRTIVNRESTPCTDIDGSNHYRFVTTSGSGGAYDIIPNQVNIYNERHVGHLLLLDDTVNFPLAMPDRENDNQSRRPTTLDLHDYQLYKQRIDAMIQQDCFPIPVAKWPAGHYCRYDDECSSNNCDNQICTDAPR